MVFDVAGLINLMLYCAQQLGVALGLGAQTIMLVAYVTAMRDRTVDDTEAQFLRATHRTLWVSLVLIVTSGIAITALHLLAGQATTVLTAAYLFKLLLIAAVVILTALWHVVPETLAEGLLGGTWYALFIVHILAPDTSWINLLELWVVWLVGFNLIWYVIVFSTREHKVKPVVISSEAAILKKSTPSAPKSPRKPFFSFFHNKKEAPKTAPVEFKPIKPDTVPKAPLVVVPETLAPVEVRVPIAPAMPAQQIKTDAIPVLARQAQPVEKMPASQMTDTPFLPQVPPLQPIPTIPPVPSAGASAPTNLAAVPVLQKPEDLPAQPTAPQLPPEVKRGLNVMPKSPEQLK